MTPREALSEYGTVYQVARTSTGSSLCIHLRADCPAVTVDREGRTIEHERQLPLRCRLCKACDPDHEVRMSPDYDDVPAAEDHDARPPWAPAEVHSDD